MTASRRAQAVIALVVVASLTIQLILLFQGGADANSGTTGDTVPLASRLLHFFSFFTIQSNIIVAVVAVLYVVRPDLDGPLLRVAWLDALLAIMITGLVFAFVLARQVHLTGWAFVATVGFHYVTPVLAPLAWLFLGPRPVFSRATELGAFVWPIAWLVYTFVHGAITDWYPYPFINAHHLGLPHALLNSLGVVVLAIVLLIVIRLADRRVRVLAGASDS